MHCSIVRGDGAHTHTLYNQHAIWHVSITIRCSQGPFRFGITKRLHLHRFYQFWFVPKSCHRLFIRVSRKMGYYTQQKPFNIGPNDDNSMRLSGSPSKFFRPTRLSSLNVETTMGRAKWKPIPRVPWQPGRGRTRSIRWTPCGTRASWMARVRWDDLRPCRLAKSTNGLPKQQVE